MPLDQLIEHYGYYAIAIGAFLQSASFAIMGGISAHRGYLELPWVIFLVSVSATLGGQLFYMFGHTKGQRLVDERPVWKAKSDQVLGFLGRHEWVLFLGYRFVPGLSTLTPLLVGVSGFNKVRFGVLNALGALLWGTTMTILGALFGKAVDLLIGDFQHYEIWVFATLVTLAMVWWADFFRKSRVAP